MADTTFASKITVIPMTWLQDLNDMYYRGKSFPATGVVTPLVKASGGLSLQSAIGSDVTVNPGGGSGWAFKDSSQSLFPGGDNDRDFGSPALRIKQIFTPIIDSGTTGTLSLRTNNGQTQVSVLHVGAAVNTLTLQGAATGNAVKLAAIGSDANVGLVLDSQGAESIYLRPGNVINFQVNPTAGANRYITVTGSNGGDPTMGVSAGTQLAISTRIVPNDFLFPFAVYGTAKVAARNSDDSGTIRLIDIATVNSLANIIRVGDSNQNTRGVHLRAFTSGVPTTSDLPTGWWALYHDVGGGTFKIYYNAAGAMKTIALA